MMLHARIALAMLCAWGALLGGAYLLITSSGLVALVAFIGLSGLGVLILPASIRAPPDDVTRD
jgi:hypothetical protein